MSENLRLNVTSSTVIAEAGLTEMEEFRQTIASLKEENAELSQFAHILAHDLRAPIKHIHNLTKMLALDDRSRFSDRALTWLDQVQAQTDHLHKLVEDLRELSKQSLNTVSRELVDLNIIAQNVLALHEADIQDHEVTVDIENLPTIYANPQLIWQLFDNLTRNVLKHGTPPIQMKIQAQQSNGHVEISFINSVSPGAKFSGDIFEFSSESTQQSTGIGLHICKKIAILHGGSIDAEMENNQFKIHVVIEEKTHA